MILPFGGWLVGKSKEESFWAVVPLGLSVEICEWETGVPGLLWLSLVVDTAVAFPTVGFGESWLVGLCPCRWLVLWLLSWNCLLQSAGEFRAELARGDGRDKLLVGLLGEEGFGLCIAIGTLADRVVWWYGGGGPWLRGTPTILAPRNGTPVPGLPTLVCNINNILY